MSQAAAAAPLLGAESPESSQRFLRAYRWMLLARVAEEKVASLYRGGKITGGVFLGKGQEAISVAGGMALRKGDIFSPLIRDQAGRLAFGEPLLDFFRTYLGSRQGPMRGRDGNIHRGKPREGLLAMISHLGAMISVANGMLMARRFKGEVGSVALASAGEGATSTGSFHEGLNQAAVERLPLVVVVTNNQYSYSTPNDRSFACRDLVDRAIGYGFEGHGADGTDLSETLAVIQNAVDAARGGAGPQLVVATSLRLVGHGEHDDAHYVDPALKAAPVGQDCLPLAEQTILRNGWADRSGLDQLAGEIQQEVEETLAQAMREAAPNPATEDWSALSTPTLKDGFSQA